MTNVGLSKNTEPEPPEAEAGIRAAALPVEGGIADYLRTYVQRVRGGETGSLPAIIGLVVLSIFFWAVHPSVGSLGNFANLLQQGAPTIFIAMGLVFVLLLGEIDLAAGTAAGVCACVMARLEVGYNAPTIVAVGAAILTGAVIGLATGWLCAKIRIPSFVVTLALFLAFQGLVLYIVNNGKGTKGNLTIRDKFVVALENGQMPVWGGWLIAALLVGGYLAVKLWTLTKRSAA